MNHSTSIPSKFHNQLQQHHPNRSIDTFDPGFQVPSTEGLGLLPPPVAYKDFQYSFPSLINFNSIGSCTNRSQSNHRSTESSDPSESFLMSIPSDLSQTCFLNSDYPWNDLNRIDPSVMRTDLSQPPPTSSVGNRTESDQLAFNQLIHHPSNSSVVPSSTSTSTITTLTYYDPCHQSSSQSSSSLPSIPMSNYPSPHDPGGGPPNEGLLTGKDLTSYYSNSSKLITPPPPLFDQSEQDLFSSFLNIFGDFNGEWDFDPKGMPEGMPVLGELKRRLEAESSNFHENHEISKIEGNQKRIESYEEGMESEVVNRLKISESRPPTRLSSVSPTRTRQSIGPLLISRPSTSSLIELSSENEESGRKKAKLKETQFVQPIITSSNHELSINLSGSNGFGEVQDDIEMIHSRELNGSKDWELDHPQIPNRFNDLNFSQSHQLPNRIPNQVSSLSLPSSTTNVIHSNPIDSLTPHSNHSNYSNQQTLKKEAEKTEEMKPNHLTKNTHIVSEQKRRNAIQGGFGSLVEILRLGELQSGITIGITDKSTNLGNGNGTNGIKVKSGRGRGRRGEIETGASKSVVLERAVEYVKWMRFGNQALAKEVERLEGLIRSDGLEI